MNFVVLVNGFVLVGMGILMGLDAALFPASRALFTEAALLMVTVGLCVSVAASARLRRPRRLHSFVLTSSVWLTGATAGAMPLWLWDLSATDAFFEAMSGITTTGSTVMTGLDDADHGILMWRAVLQWVGGIGFIVTGIAVLPILRVGGMQLFRTESSERGEKEMNSAARFASATVWIYLALTALCALAYRTGGMTFFEAVVHAMTTLSTGGYSTSDQSFGHFDAPFLHWAGSFFMAAGALPFAWYIRLARGRSVRSEQVVAFLATVGTAIALLTAWRVWDAGAPLPETLRLVTFNVISVVTTTGYATTDYTTWGPLAAAAFFLLTAVGGCTGSTAGGAKIMRWIIFARFAVKQVRSVRVPHGVFVARYDGRPVQEDVLSGVMTFFVFYASTVFLLAMALTFCEIDFVTALSGALTAVANVGPGVGSVIGPAGTFASLPDIAKWLLCFGMYAGRLEMMTIFVLLTPVFWREVF